MPPVRKKSSGGGARKNRGWLLLLIGLGIGVAAAFLVQMVIERNLHRTVAEWFKRDRPSEVEKSTRKDSERPKSRFDFYTILPETETVLPERARREAKIARTERPEEGVTYILQVASFTSFDDADQLKAKLALQGLQAQIQKVTIEGKGEYHRVRLGPYEKLEDLDAAGQQLAKLGIKAMRLKVKKDAGYSVGAQ